MAADLCRGAFAVGWLAGAAFFGVALHWIVEPFQIDADRHAWMAPFAAILTAGGFALFWGGAFWAARAMRDRLGGAAAPALVLFWAGAEMLRSWIFTGFPWALPAHVWIETPVAQSAALIGPYALSAATLAVAAAPGAAIGPGRWRWAPAGLAALALAGAWGWGATRLPDGPAPAAGPRVRLAQPNVPQGEKWRDDLEASHFRRLLDLTAEPAATGEIAIVVWPESATSFPIDRAPEARAAIAAASPGAAVVVGSLRLSGETGGRRRWRNSLFVLDARRGGAPAAVYDKTHLVPFGEYLPFSETLADFGLAALAATRGGMEAGGPAPPLDPPGPAPPFAASICYEIIFSRETLAATEGAEWILQATNDAWFGDWAGPEQHLAQARLRAIETGLPVARAANTGISAMIDPYGRVIDRLALGARGVIDAALPSALERGPYARHGALFAPVALLALLAAQRFGARRGEV